jgi:hypothetical protein
VPVVFPLAEVRFQGNSPISCCQRPRCRRVKWFSIVDCRLSIVVDTNSRRRGSFADATSDSAFFPAVRFVRNARVQPTTSTNLLFAETPIVLHASPGGSDRRSTWRHFTAFEKKKKKKKKKSPQKTPTKLIRLAMSSDLRGEAAATHIAQMGNKLPTTCRIVKCSVQLK